MIYLPIIGAFLEAAGMILEKKMLKIRGLNYKNYTVFGFFGIILMLIPFLLFFWRIDSSAFEMSNLGILGLVILSSTIANLLIFYSLKREDITEFEPAWLMQPLFTLILAVIFYSSERNWLIFGLGLIASSLLIVTHVKGNRLFFDRYFVAALLGSLFFSIELVLSRSILEHYSPFTFYFIRCLGILVVGILAFRPRARIINGKLGLMFLALGVLWVIYRAIIYYGYLSLGVVFTTIIFILSPVLMLVFAVVFLKERPSLKQIICNVAIFVCVVIAVLFGR